MQGDEVMNLQQFFASKGYDISEKLNWQKNIENWDSWYKGKVRKSNLKNKIGSHFIMTSNFIPLEKALFTILPHATYAPCASLWSADSDGCTRWV